jgi:hypothetical protein
MTNPNAAQKDLVTLATFIRVYCLHNHCEETKRVVRLNTHDLPKLMGGSVVLCPGCAKLLAHAFYKRSVCPFDPKPACKHCTRHCYHPTCRAQIREVMKFSGKHLLLSGRLDYLLHLLF